MRYYLLLALLFATLFTYGQAKTKHEMLIGSWCKCKYDGTYVEIHYQPEHIREFIGVDNDFISDFWFYYKLSNDTIVYAKTPLNSLYETDSIRKATIYFIDEKLLVWHSQSHQVNDTLHRIEIDFISQPASRSIEVANKWYEETREKFSKRMAKANCTDRRPPSERRIEKVNLGEIPETPEFEEIIYSDSLRGFE